MTPPNPMTLLMTDAIKDFLRELTGRFVEHPEAIVIGYQASDDGAYYWALESHRDDEGKLIGAGGSHVRAMEAIVEAIGVARRQIHTFRLITRHRPRPRSMERLDVATYDPSPDRDLLYRLLGLLGAPCAAITISPGDGPRTSLRYIMSVHVSKSQYDSLCNPGLGGDGHAIAEHIGTIFRAIAERNGVRYQVSVVKPGSA